MAERKYRSDLPEVPERIAKLPIMRGYPVPWFVDKVDGEYDFRVADSRKLIKATTEGLCWVCGEKRGAFHAFAIGPMCAVNRVNSEPPSHKECAVWSVKACPFLNQREKDYRSAGLDPRVIDPAGIPIVRQPGAICIWVTKTFRLIKAPGGVGFLFQLGDPEEVLWYSHAREATIAEVVESIESGLPILQEMAAADGWAAERDLEDRLRKVRELLPKEALRKRLPFGSAARGKVLGG